MEKNMETDIMGYSRDYRKDLKVSGGTFQASGFGVWNFWGRGFRI